jgi:proteic killer suppression protein
MIESFRHRALKDLFETGRSAKIAPGLQARIRIRLDAIDAATDLNQLNQPGFNLHPLKTTPRRYSIHVNGPWAVTFEWEKGNAKRVDLEQYH